MVTEPALWVIRLPPPPTTVSLTPLCTYGSITFTHLKENFSIVKLPYLCKKSKGKTCMVGEPSHVKQLSLNIVCKIGLKSQHYEFSNCPQSPLQAAFPPLYMAALQYLYEGGRMHDVYRYGSLKRRSVSSAVYLVLVLQSPASLKSRFCRPRPVLWPTHAVSLVTPPPPCIERMGPGLYFIPYGGEENNWGIQNWDMSSPYLDISIPV